MSTTTNGNGSASGNARADAPKRQRRCAMAMDFPNETVTFRQPTAADGKPGAVVFVAECKKLPAEIRQILMVDRCRNKLMDSYSDPASDPAAEMGKVWDGLLAGNWSVRGEAAERTSLFVEAYAFMAKRDVADIRAVVNALELADDAESKAKLKAARSHPQIVARMAEITRERAVARAAATATAAKSAPRAALPTL